MTKVFGIGEKKMFSFIQKLYLFVEFKNGIYAMFPIDKDDFGATGHADIFDGDNYPRNGNGPHKSLSTINQIFTFRMKVL